MKASDAAILSWPFPDVSGARVPAPSAAARIRAQSTAQKKQKNLFWT